MSARKIKVGMGYLLMGSLVCLTGCIQEAPSHLELAAVEAPYPTQVKLSFTEPLSELNEDTRHFTLINAATRDTLPLDSVNIGGQTATLILKDPLVLTAGHVYELSFAVQARDSEAVAKGQESFLADFVPPASLTLSDPKVEQPQSQTPRQSRVEARQSAPSKREPSEPAVNITLHEGRLSLSVEHLSVHWIVERISSASMVPMIWDSGVQDRPVSVELREVPLDQALLEILKDYDTFLFYGADKKEGEPPAVTVVWIYPRGKGMGLQPLPPEEWASTKELEGMLSDRDPEVRSRAIRTLIERRGQGAEEAVFEALGDENDDVRTAALHQAIIEGLELPVDSLIDLALDDPSSSVRFLALEVLEAVGYNDIQWIAEQILNDPNPHLQLKARKILEPEAAPESNMQPQPAQW